MEESRKTEKQKHNVREMVKIFDGSQRPVFLPRDVLKIQDTRRPSFDTSSSSESENDEHFQGSSNFQEDSSDEDASYSHSQFGRYLNIPEIVDETKNFLREEENYCQQLENLVENYIKTLKTDRFDDVLEVFGRIDLICAFQNNTFLPDLKSSRDASKIADCFIKHKNLFNTYYECYFINQPNMILSMQENKDVFMASQSQEEYKDYEDILLKTINERIESYHDFLEYIKRILANYVIVTTNFNRATEIVANLTKNFSPKEKNIRFVISEIVGTERNYIERLKKITQHVIPKIEDMIKQRSRQRSVIGNIPLIYVKQQGFYEDLKECLYAFDPSEVATCFIQHTDDFMQYVEDQKMKNNPNAMDECRELLERANERNFDFYTPLNRLYKYKLLLQELQKCCQKGGVPHDRVEEASNMITGIISKMNGVAAINCIKDENIYLYEQGELILRDVFVVEFKESKYDAMVFLFEKSIIFTEIKTEGPKKNRRDVFIYNNHIITKHLAITLNKSSPTAFQVQFYGKPKTLHILKAKDKETTDAWTSAIKDILMKQFQEEKQRNS